MLFIVFSLLFSLVFVLCAILLTIFPFFKQTPTFAPNAIVNATANSKDYTKKYYNLGDLLNAPIMMKGSKTWSPVGNCLSPDWPGSIKNIYCKLKGRMPELDVATFRRAILQYFQENENACAHLIEKASKESAFCIHIRTGDTGIVEKKYVNAIIKVAQNFKNCYILTGVHGGRHAPLWLAIKRTRQSLNFIVRKLSKVEYIVGSADEHMVMMAFAKNLIIHKGGFSLLGSLACQGNVYTTDLFLGNSLWQKKMVARVIAV